MSFWRPGEERPHAGANAGAGAGTGIPSSAAGAVEAAPRVAQLSKNVLNMRFMKRKEEGAVQSKEEATKRRKLLDAVHGSGSAAVDMQVDGPQTPDGAAFTYEMTDLYSTLPGRRSFNGFNKNVERNYAEIWDSAANAFAVMKLENAGTNIGWLISHSSVYEPPHTFQGITLHESMRRLDRRSLP